MTLLEELKDINKQNLKNTKETIFKKVLKNKKGHKIIIPSAIAGGLLTTGLLNYLDK